MSATQKELQAYYEAKLKEANDYIEKLEAMTGGERKTNMTEKVAEIGPYQIHLNSIGWYTIYKIHDGGARVTRCGSWETLDEARCEVIKIMEMLW